MFQKCVMFLVVLLLAVPVISRAEEQPLSQGRLQTAAEGTPGTPPAIPDLRPQPDAHSDEASPLIDDLKKADAQKEGHGFMSHMKEKWGWWGMGLMMLIMIPMMVVAR